MNILIDNTTGEELASYMKPAIKTSYNAKYFPKQKEINRLPSRTVPDQTLPLRTILDRYARGLPISGSNLTPLFNGDQQLPDVKRLDISEIHQWKEYVREEIKHQQSELQEQTKPKQKPTKKEDPKDEK